jgi:hypothetical protein
MAFTTFSPVVDPIFWSPVEGENSPAVTIIRLSCPDRQDIFDARRESSDVATGDI